MDNTHPPYEPNDADIEYAKAQIRRAWTPAEEQRRMCPVYRNKPVTFEPVSVPEMESIDPAYMRSIEAH